MSGITTRAALRFRHKDVIVAHATESIAAILRFPEKLLLQYERRVPANASGKYDEVYAEVNLTEMVNACKSYDKREEVDILGAFGEDGILTYMNLQRGSNAVDAVNCGHPSVTEIGPYFDFKKYFYAGCRPTAKLVSARFSKIMVNCKSRNCTSISFIISPEGLLIKGYHNNTIVHITNCDDETDNEDEALEDDSKSVITGDNGTKLIVSNYTINIVFREVREWMTKINRLSPVRSVISLYLKPNCPLVIETMVGSIGKANFIFTNAQ